MRAARLGVAILVGAAAVLLGFSPAASTAATPIGPHQHYVGVVNGQTANVVVHTVCPGPVSGSQLGPVAGGQSFAVRRAPSGGGQTGVLSGMYVWFTADASWNGHHAVSIADYRTSTPMSSSFRVPCDGTGTVEFSSCPYLAPCAAGWSPAYVSVRFVDIAA